MALSRQASDLSVQILIGEAYKAMKMARGAAAGFRGNQHTKMVSAQNEHLPKSPRTSQKIAEQFGVGKETVNRAEHFLAGLTAASAHFEHLGEEQAGSLRSGGPRPYCHFLFILSSTASIIN